MERWQGKVAVVTGASAGIGADICQRLVQVGLQVVGLARRVDQVKELSKKLSGKPGKLFSVQCDVSKEEDVMNAFKWVKDNVGPVHILINNAGLYKDGSIMEGTPSDWQTVLNTNVMGLTMCTQQAVKQMREGNIAGHIVNINSIAGHQRNGGNPPIMTNLYSPSKHAVTCLSDIMQQELHHFKTDIKVSSVSPGLVSTDIWKAAGSNMPIEKLPHIQPADISDAIIYLLGTPPNVLIRELTITPLHPIDLADHFKQ